MRVVPSGSDVRFANYDPFRHNVFSDAGPGRFDLGLYGRGETRAAKVGAPGVYPVFCNIHARMVAYLVAVPSRWYAQAGTDGPPAKICRAERSASRSFGTRARSTRSALP